MRTIYTLLAAVVATTSIGCGDDTGGDVTALKIGFLIPQTGALEGIGPGMTNATRLAVQEINSAGGINGRPVEALIRDSRSDTDTTVAEAMSLLDEGIIGLVGPMRSAASIEVQALTLAAQVPEISCCSSSPDLATIQPERDRFFFRVIPPDDLQARALMVQANRLLCGSVALMYIDDPFGQPFDRIVGGEWPGGLAASIPFVDAAASYQSQVDELVAANPDCVMLVGFPGQLGVILREYGSTPGANPDIQWIGVESVQDTNLPEVAGDPALLRNLSGVAPTFAPSTPEYQDFAASYEAAYSEQEPGYGSLQYDAAALLALAASSVADPTDGVAVRDAIYAVATPDAGDLLAAPSRLAEGILNVSEGRGINYEGAANSVDFDNFGNTTSSYVIWEFNETDVAFEEVGVIRPTDL